MLLLYILWDDWPIFMISASNEQLQQELVYTLLKPDCHSWWIPKNAIWHFRKTICNNSVLKLEKNDANRKRMECFRVLFDHLAWNEHQFLKWHKRFKEGRESVRDDERCGRSKEVNTPELIGQTVRVTMLRF